MCKNCITYETDVVPDGYIPQIVAIARYPRSESWFRRMRAECKIGEALAHGMVYVRELDVQKFIKPVRVKEPT